MSESCSASSSSIVDGSGPRSRGGSGVLVLGRSGGVGDLGGELAALIFGGGHFDHGSDGLEGDLVGGDRLDDVGDRVGGRGFLDGLDRGDRLDTSAASAAASSTLASFAAAASTSRSISAAGGGLEGGLVGGDFIDDARRRPRRPSASSAVSASATASAISAGSSATATATWGASSVAAAVASVSGAVPPCCCSVN